MDIRDNQLDDAIALALETQTVVTARQKAAAWDQLHTQAQQQVMLSPYAVSPAPPASPRADLYLRTTDIMRTVFQLLTDDRVYHRAAANRHFAGVTHSIGNAIMIHYYPLQPMLRYAF